MSEELSNYHSTCLWMTLTLKNSLSANFIISAHMFIHAWRMQVCPINVTMNVASTQSIKLFTRSCDLRRRKRRRYWKQGVMYMHRTIQRGCDIFMPYLLDQTTLTTISFINQLFADFYSRVATIQEWWQWHLISSLNQTIETWVLTWCLL